MGAVHALSSLVLRMARRLPSKLFLTQSAMLRVCYALVLPALAGVYLFGWRAFALVLVSLATGLLTEALFTFRDGKPVTSAVLVTGLIFGLSLPPSLPLWMAVLGMMVAVGIGKMAFGGLGQNVFNPAMVGRCFLYITFPVQMTNQWVEPFWGGGGGFLAWAGSVEALSRATPLEGIRKGVSPNLWEAVVGNIPGSVGETSTLLILAGGVYLIYRKAAPWRIALACLVSGIGAAVLLKAGGQLPGVSVPAVISSGGFMFGTAFVATEPITAPKTTSGQWIYGAAIGGLTVALRRFSNFAESFMFVVLLMNALVPILERTVRAITARKQAPK